MFIIRRGILTLLSSLALAYALMLPLFPGAAHAQGDAIGSISVLIIPPGAVTSDAQWNVDGGAFVDSEQTLNGLSVGEHLVCFKDTPEYETPNCQTVTVLENETTFIVAEYIPQRGSVTASILPPEVLAAGARWRVDGGPNQVDGAIVDGLSLGDHIVSFTAIPGWITPANVVVRVRANQIATAPGVYVRQTGSLTVGINPAAANTAGAQWNVDGGTFVNGGTTVSGLAVGTHVVSFRTIPGWVTPANQIVTINFNQVTTASATYQQQAGGIQVTLSPAGAIAAGAQWQVDNGPAQNSGATLNGLSAGTHTLSFTVAAGFTKPANRQITILPNQVIEETGVYSAQTGGIKATLLPVEAVTLGAQWRVDDGELLNSGVTVNGLSLGEHVVSFTNVEGFVAPVEQTITVTANQVTNVTGEYGPLVGNLTVSIEPIGAINAGARWRVDGGAFQESGATVSGLLVGSHIISFTNVPGFDKPDNRTVAIVSEQTTTETGVYSPQFGGLTVSLSPQGAVAAGAQWKVDGGPYQNSGAVVNNLSYGTHLLSFKPVNGFATPGNQVVNIGANQITSTTGVYTTQFGGLTVYMEPAAALNAGAQWQVDDGPFQGSGTIANNLSVGNHIVYFKTIPGFAKPNDLTVAVLADQIVTRTVQYQPESGGLTVTISPPSAVAAGAQWKLDNGTFRDSGATQNGIPTGAHTLSFKDTPGFETPREFEIVINANQVRSESVTFAPGFGGLTVTLSPVSAITAGAQWQVDGGAFQNSGATVNSLAYGLHTLSFKPVSGFPTPADKTVVIDTNKITQATGDYTLQTGGLTVTLSPPSAVSAGAQWNVDGGPFQNSGTTANRLPIGSHTIFFKPVSGFPTPESQAVTVNANQVTSATGRYAAQSGGVSVTLSPASAVAAGAQWQVDGGAFQNSGATVNGLDAGVHTISYKPVTGYATPADATVTVELDEVATATGQYTQDTGSLTVTLSPASALAAGAGWKLDNGATQTSGATLNNIPVGTHTLSFTEVSGFTTPASQTVTVLKDQTISASGAYTESAAACCAGAKQVKSFREAFDLYKADFSLLFGAMVTLVAMSRFKRTGA